MSTGWPAVPLGEVLTHCKDFIESPEDRMYPKLSVRLYGKGVVIDAPADGATLKMKRHQLARAGQVILSEIWGKKRAIGFVPLEGEGALCTSHFFLFDVNEEQLYRGWLAAVFRTNYLAVQLGAQAFGTTGYAAVRPNDLLAASIPLPRFPSSGGSWRRSSSWPARSRRPRDCGVRHRPKPNCW
jgi:type I restriction enzyme S subunit